MKMAEKEYIEREAAMDAILKQPPDAHYPEWYARDIREIPTADVVEVRHGVWILHTDGNGTCDQCKVKQKYVWDYDNSQNYSGHCGAKMDGKK